MINLTRATIEISIPDNPIKFVIIHNLKKNKGLKMSDVLDSWILSTKKFTAYNFCKYIMSKDKSVIAITETQYKRLSKLGDK